eukprot:TRINITY_DN26810_c0_g1_i1.p2 TRINITY_DN26810_c0_g1~~TRINITY_DN26810_c0_g1_i1.p2  ORF type:complete len:201 (+),score=77.24 TRINITY_DN26810_c0_g1_i1:72-605(+)
MAAIAPETVTSGGYREPGVLSGAPSHRPLPQGLSMESSVATILRRHAEALDESWAEPDVDAGDAAADPAAGEEVDRVLAACLAQGLAPGEYSEFVRLRWRLLQLPPQDLRVGDPQGLLRLLLANVHHPEVGPPGPPPLWMTQHVVFREDDDELLEMELAASQRSLGSGAPLTAEATG